MNVVGPVEKARSGKLSMASAMRDSPCLSEIRGLTRQSQNCCRVHAGSYEQVTERTPLLQSFFLADCRGLSFLGRQ